jgi:hypothetical protein
VLQGTVNIYFIWYGDWTGDGANGTNTVSDSPITKSLLSGLIPNISGSLYEWINTSYQDGAGNPASSVLNLAKSVDDAYSHGNNLTELDIYHVITDHLGLTADDPNSLPFDNNGIYFVLTSSDVNQTLTGVGTFAYNYCGWHGSIAYFSGINGGFNALDPNARFGFVGNSDRNGGACEPRDTTSGTWSNVSASPNNDPGGDGMVNHVMHEINEAIVDPDHTSWYEDPLGQESEDLCAWKFDNIVIVPPANYAYDRSFNGVNYMIQMSLYNLNTGYGYCYP